MSERICRIAQASLMSLLALVPWSCAPGSSKRPNVLIIVWDTVRPDRLTPYGYELPTTPHLEEFARDSLLYERAVSPGMWTLPSHASLFTGLPASAHGVNSHHQWLDNRFRTLAEIFGDAGYATYAFSANAHMSAKANLVQGFETVEHPWEEPWVEVVGPFIDAKLIPEDSSTEISPGRHRDPEHKERNYKEGILYKEAGPIIADAFFGWLEKRPAEQPFFVFLNYMESHIPRIPSLEARRQVMDEEMIQRSFKVDQFHLTMLSYLLRKHEYSPEEIEVLSRIYDAALIDLDQATQALLQGMKEIGLLDDTIVVITSDHGENLGDHHMTGHKFCLYNTLTRVPLIIRYPERVKPGRVAKPVSVLNVFATILDLAGLPGPEAGVLSRSLFGPEKDRGREEPIFSELVAATPSALKKVSDLYPDLVWEPWMRTFKSVELGSYKFIQASDDDDELFLLPEDPSELNNLVESEATQAASMNEAIQHWLTTFTPYDPTKAAQDDEPGLLSPRVRRELRALGYIN